MQTRKFIGRRALLRQACLALRGGEHVFIHGPFGIGKTTFAIESLKQLGLPRYRLSFELSAHEMAESLLKQIVVFESVQPKRKRSGKMSGARGYQSLNALKMRLRVKSENCQVVILDDIFSVTHQKTKFLRFMQTLGIRFVCVIESTKYPKDLFLLRSVCLPHRQLTLPRLSKAESIELMTLLNEHNGRALSREQIESWIPHLNGYPLMIVERVLGPSK